MFNAQAALAALEQNDSAINAALGAEAARKFWAETFPIRQTIHTASDPQTRDEAARRLEEVCRRHQAVWKLVAPAAAPPSAPGSPQMEPKREKRKKEEEAPMTTSPEKPAAPKPSSGPTLETWLVALREGVTGCLGVLIVLTTLLLLLSTFVLLLLRPNAEFSPLRDLLLILNGMTGVVLGYYFGRMPAEARARQAETERASAEGQAATEASRSAVMQAGLRDLAADLDRQAQLAPAAKGLAPAPASFVDLRDKVRRLLDETSR